MKNKLRKLTSAALILSLSLFVSCGETAIDTDTSSSDTADTSSAEESSQFVADDLPDNLDLGGAEVKIHVGDYNNAYIDDMYSAEETGNRLSDAVYRTIHSVEDRLNVTLSYDYDTFTFAELSTHQSMITSGILAGDNSLDILFDVWNYSAQMLEGDYFINLADTKYIDIDKPWYNQTVRDNMPDDNIYFLSGQFSLANVKNIFAIYYNADLYDSLGKTENLYELVDSGKWTIDKLEELTKDTYADLNGNTEADSGDRYGLTFGDYNKYLGFLKAFEADIFVKGNDGYEFAYDNERALEIIDRLCSFVNDNENVLPALFNSDNPEFMISTGGGNYESKLFVEGNSLFSCSLIADAATIVPSIDFAYGLLPYPKWDESQENYKNMLQRNCYVLMPVTVSDADTASAVLEALSSESYRTLVPEYCEVSLKTRYSQDDDVSRMFDLIINSIVYDPGEIFANLLGSPSAMFRSAIKDNNKNWASTVAAVKDTLVEKMNQITEGD